jgi:hypothetical protein
VVVAQGFALCLPAFGQLSQILTPTSPYTGGTLAMTVTVPDSTVLSVLAAGTQTITFSSSMTALTVGGIGGWGFWGSPPQTESSTPRVLGTPADLTSLTMTLGAAVNTFGFEVEPANSGGLPATAFPFTATFFNGATPVGSVSRSVTFNSAALIAASSATPITSVRVTAPAAAGGFAIAQLRSGNLALATASVPAVGPVALCGLALLLAGTAVFVARRAAPLH